jgi:hypothetical protein
MQIDPLLFLIMVELLVVTVAVSIGLAFIWFSRKRRDKKAAVTLVARIKEDRDRRKDETKDILNKRFGFTGDQLEELATTIDREEKRFYQVLINTYLRRDVAVLENIYIEYEGAVNPYRKLEPPLEAAPAASGTGDINESAEMLRLKEENKRLSEEVRITMETMGRMLNEYSAMFAGGGSDELDKEKIKSMFQEQAESLGEKLDTAMEKQQLEEEKAAEESAEELSAETLEETPSASEDIAEQEEDAEEITEEPVVFGEAEGTATEAEGSVEVGEITVEEIPADSGATEGDVESSSEQEADEEVEKE